MDIELLALILVAAASGKAFRTILELLATKTGHSREKVDEALATGGISLVAEERTHDAPPRDSQPVA